jgi:hypothetical protein
VRDEGRDGGVVVLEALDLGAGRRQLGQLLVLDGAAGDGHRLAGQVGHAADLGDLGPKMPWKKGE